jgi:hypothetical protein
MLGWFAAQPQSCLRVISDLAVFDLSARRVGQEGRTKDQLEFSRPA